MTVDHKVSFCIVIAFAVVYSAYSDVKGETNTICSKIVRITKSRDISYKEIWWNWNSSYRTENYMAWRLQLYCCNGYKYENQTCNPQCSSMCNNGYCAQPNICKCDYGWGGEFCDKLRLCFIRVDITEATSELPVLDPYLTEMTIPECPSECRDQLSTVSNMTRSADNIYYFFPIDSPCNPFEASAVPRKGYSHIIGSVLGIIVFFIIIICILYIVRKNRKTRSTVDNDAMESNYDDAKPRSIQPVLSDDAMKVEYDYVDPSEIRPVLPDETMELTYQNVERRNIHPVLADNAPTLIYDYADPREISPCCQLHQNMVTS